MTSNGQANGVATLAAPIPLQRFDYPGSLIVVEGVDGSGKSTQLQLLREWLVESGADVLFTEWNSSSLTAKAVRRGKRRLWLGHLSFVLLHVTDFTHRYENIILPALREARESWCWPTGTSLRRSRGTSPATPTGRRFGGCTASRSSRISRSTSGCRSTSR
jgi:hypothetical protein